MTKLDFSNLSMGAPSANQFQPSPLQKAIFHEIDTTNDSLIIEAVAGSGKTTTIVKACNYIPSSSRTLFLAFNKSIVTELQNRLPSHVKASTFHSLGLAATYNFLGRRPTVNFKKMQDLMDEIYGKSNFSKKFSDKIALQRLIGFAKANGHYWEADHPSTSEWLDLIDYHDMNFDVSPEVYLSKLTDVYMESLNWTDEIDFDDMLLHPVFHNYEFQRYDNIICDESQDLSGLQHVILERALAPGGRIIAVGDTHQAIYGFRGADSSSMGNLKKMFSMRELPLNVSYRCSKAIRNLAQEFVPHFESLPDAPEGDIDEINDLPQPSLVSKDTMVLCRLNAPLFKYGMSFLNSGTAVQLWTNLDNTLRSRIKSFKATSTSAWRSQVSHWVQKEIDLATEKEKWARVQSVRDIHETLLALSEGTTQVRQIERNLSNLVDSKSGPILSTIHKSKGHEAHTCMIINYNLMPSKFAAKKKWMLQQEYNIIYVALTRAKSDLILHHFED